MIPIPDTLRAFAEDFPTDLYVVGGYVRDALRGIRSDDLDICSSLPAEAVEEHLKNTPYKISTIKRDTGTVGIRCDGKEWQYTAFRTDVYTTGHNPAFTAPADIIGDALRRDFRANAVYYDIKNDLIVDPLGGVQDIEKGLFVATRPPEIVFSEDGLRLMRLARLCAETGFVPSPDTLDGARKNAGKIKEIAKERIRTELERILQSEKPSIGLRLLYDENVMQIILPEIADGYGMPQKSPLHAYDVFGHTLATVDAAAPAVRTAAFFHDIGKPVCNHQKGNFAGHPEVGADICTMVMNRLRYPKNVIKDTKRLVLYHSFSVKGETDENDIRLFLQKNADIAERLCLLMEADWNGCGGPGTGGKSKAADRLRKILLEMKEEGVPFSVKDLKVRGDDVPEDILPKCKRADALKALLEACAQKGSPLTTKEKQLQYIIDHQEGR